MDDLVLLLIAFLNAVYVQGDIKAAKMALILSETFYTEPSISDIEYKTKTSSNKSDSSLNLLSDDEHQKQLMKDQRFYVQDGIKDHACWKSKHFWEETFHLAVREEIHRNIIDTSKSRSDSNYSNTSSTSSTSDYKNYKIKLSKTNRKNITYAQIGSSAFNMLSVGRPKEEVIAFVGRMCNGNDFTENERNHLLTSLLNTR